MTFAFDPDYTRNGVFYTLHMEEPGVPAGAIPDTAAFPGLSVSGYTVTPAIDPPGGIQRESVLIERTDTDVTNATFEGTAQKVFRVGLNTRIHPRGDLIPRRLPGSSTHLRLFSGP